MNIIPTTKINAIRDGLQWFKESMSAQAEIDYLNKIRTSVKIVGYKGKEQISVVETDLDKDNLGLMLENPKTFLLDNLDPKPDVNVVFGIITGGKK